jgi:LmbE family N-acetylglucosaminyl deacetylase
MLGIIFNKENEARLNILCIGAHSDDIEIGCGGTILRLVDEFPNLNFYWIVLGSNQLRCEEAFNSANAMLRNVNDKKIYIKGFKDGFFPFIGAEIKDYFEQLKQEISPDLIFTHYRHDLHQDHRLISELTWNTFRNHLILEYEIPKYDGDIGSPNFFVQLSESTCLKKIQHLLTYFQSQIERDWFTADTFQALLRLRGMEAKSPDKFAEGFYCRKIVF